MGQYNLSRIFKPQQVAVVGASEKTGTIGNALMRNLIDGGFSGTILPVNPKYQSINGYQCFKKVSALKTGVDLAIIATPIGSVADIVSECVEKRSADRLRRPVAYRGARLHEYYPDRSKPQRQLCLRDDRCPRDVTL